MTQKVQALQAWLALIPHWLFLLVMAFIGGATTYLLEVPSASLVTALTTTTGVLALVKAAGVAGLIAIISLLKSATAVEVSAVRAARAAAKAATAAIFLFYLVTAQTACNQPVFPMLDKIEKVVLADLVNGDTREQIERDVAEVVAGQTGADVVTLVNDAITFLLDAGLVPQNWIPKAKELQKEEGEKLRKPVAITTATFQEQRLQEVA